MSKLMNMAEVSTSALVAAHNAAAEMLGQKTVSKFQDRATAERRTRAMVSQITDLSKRPEPFREGEAAQPSAPVVQGTKEQASKPADTPKPSGALDFGERPGSKRERLIKILVRNRNEYVTLADLIGAVYGGNVNEFMIDEMKGPLMMVMKGMEAMIEKRKLPVKIVKQKQGKDIKYGLIDA